MHFRFLLISLFSVLISCAGVAKRTTAATKDRPVVLPPNQSELATACAKDSEKLPEDYLIPHRAYTLSYNFHHRVANWVYHRLSRENLKNSCAKRKDNFKSDPALTKASLPAVTEKDYQGSVTGFDRGHMAPSADFLWDQDVNKESFFMTNMAPQTVSLNQRAWNNLEDRFRLWACGSGELRIYTGPVLKAGLNRLKSCVSVPEQFYKIAVAYRDGKYRGIAFIYNQTDDKDPYRERAVSIREVEKTTGLDFFKDEFSQAVQDSFEKEFQWSDWDGIEQDCKACPVNP